ncbi:MAG: Vitamin B12 dependent methionine synthase activation subunit [Clostridia bacterium]|nr:Vitamin B12 dependent methionine synthase activation subunit [Clostridia bacterium]
MIYIENGKKDEIEIKTSEVLRYLGYGKNLPDENVKAEITRVTDEILSSVNPKTCFALLDITIKDNTIDFGVFSAFSKSLAKNLKLCKKAVIFGATIGTETDRIISRYAKLTPSSAVIAQAVGTTAIESWCDIFCSRLGEKFKKDGLFLMPRFSPGYADFLLSHQKDIFNLLNCPKNIGVSITDTLIMTPSKSVTAVVGLSDEDIKCKTGGCENCDKASTCEYLRGE